MTLQKQKQKQKAKMHQNNKTDHVPVLLEEVLKCLAPQKGETYLDVTAGYGGHAQEILELTNSQAVLVDRDNQAVEHLRTKFKSEQTEIVYQDFLTASQNLKAHGKKFDLILADLGVSSPHLNMASRGFSFQADGPLDMRMDISQELTANHVVNNYSESELAKLIRLYGEEPKAKKIAHEIVLNRPIKTTTQLAGIVESVVKRKKNKLHPATKTFQAIRIVVNNELNLLAQALPIWLDMLEPGGRIAIITFHSLEDRLVKQALGDEAGNRYDASLRLLTKKPITAGQNEIAFNPRARSAKLRAAVKIKT